MVPYYEPLCLPDGARLHGRFPFGSLSYDPALLVDQLERRGPIPPEVWGPDPARRQLAAVIGQVVKEQVECANAHFIPEDPFAIMLWGWCWDGMDGTEALMCIGQMTGRDLHENEEVFERYDITFGEVVDALLRESPEEDTIAACVVPRPYDAQEAPEAQPCPALATFLKIRSYLAGPLIGMPRKSIRPSTPLQRRLSLEEGLALEDFVDRRLGVKSGLYQGKALLDPSLTALTATAVVVVAWTLFCGALTVATSSGWESFLESLELVSLFGAIGLALTFLYSVHLLLALLSPGFWRSLLKRGREIVTFGDLVRWVLAERQRKYRSQE